jgi:ACT domain-containing protein
MIMVGDVDKLNIPFGDFCEAMENVGKDINMAIHVMHEDIFNSMHKI